ncbi:MAG: gliding motility-associated C-terminal domain-containing protein [Flavobacteriales bacterium]|nr:gliding motility-associated C-terminal domain-containing protein [Flavobacteriales bacterium]
MLRKIRLFLLALPLATVPRISLAQNFNFTSGPIPLCDTTYFTATVSGIGALVYPGSFSDGYYLSDVWLNITTNHPQTLQIFLTSPNGFVLLLSQFNGAGGQNYTDTHFNGWQNITTGTAPFTGSFLPQGGSDLGNYFAGWSGDGIWTLTVIDTACANGGTGPDGDWVPGSFGGGGGGGGGPTGGAGMGFGYNIGNPWVHLPDVTVYLCPGGSVDILGYYWESVYIGGVLGTPDPPNPNAVTTPGTYGVVGSHWDQNFIINSYPADPLGPDQSVVQCDLSVPVNLAALFQVTDLTLTWSFNGSPIPASTAVSATNAGVYQVIGQNANGCNDTALVTLANGSDFLGADQSLNICNGSSTDLTTLFPTSGATETWFFGGTSIPAPTAASNPGTYTLVATAASGCADTAEVVLNALPAVALGADQAATLCSNATVDLAALFTTTGLSSAWTLNNATVPDPTAVDTAGLYTLVATNGSGCSDTAQVTLVSAAAPVLGPDAAQATCEGNTVDLTASFNPAGLTTAWTLSGAAVPDPTAVGATGLYTLVATNAAGCSDTAQVAVTINPDPVLGADQSITACTGHPVNLGSLYDTAPHVAVWTVNGTPVPDPAAVTNAGSYLLTVTSSEGCSATATVDLAFVPAPDLGADMALTICADSMIDLATLYPTTGLSATWTQGSALVTYASGVALPGMYQLVVSNGACTDTAKVVLTVNPNPSLGEDQPFTLCPWQTVNLGTLFPTDGLSTAFTLNGVPVANPDSVHAAGVYAVTATNAAGCSDVANAIITNMDCLCEADFQTDALCLQEPAQFTLIADSTVQAVHWDFGGAATASTELNPEVHFEAGQDVPVTLQATLSCGVVTVEHIVHVEDCSQSCHLWFPNSFTPDKDDKNDMWNWAGDCTPDPYKLMIFNRWGELIFSTTDPHDAWDGTYGGVPSPIGVYVYKAEYQFPYQDAQTAIGHITLVR